MRVESTDYLLPVDYQPVYTGADAKYYAYSIDHHKMQERGTKINVIILDACRDNPYVLSKGLAHGLAGTTAAVGTFIMYAASPGKTASANESSKNSLFTAVLVEELERQPVNLRQMAYQVKNKVYELSGGTQLPYISENLIGDLVLGDDLASSAEPVAEPQTTTSGAGEHFDTSVRGHSNAGTWIDSTTKLTWAQRENGIDVSWFEAKNYCDHLRVAGYGDWRLPTIQELDGICDRTKNVNGHHIKGGGIKMSKDSRAWSATLPQKGHDRATTAGFTGCPPIGHAVLAFSWTKHTRALCVRGSRE
jgi:Protein of unknown function (DUF1566)/Caspase domain